MRQFLMFCLIAVMPIVHCVLSAEPIDSMEDSLVISEIISEEEFKQFRQDFRILYGAAWRTYFHLGISFDAGEPIDTAELNDIAQDLEEHLLRMQAVAKRVKHVIPRLTSHPNPRFGEWGRLIESTISDHEAGSSLYQEFLDDPEAFIASEVKREEICSHIKTMTEHMNTGLNLLAQEALIHIKTKKFRL